jgi:polyisoprenoid-binding protein YceI
MKKKILFAVAIILTLLLIAFITLKIMTKNAERNVATEKPIIVSAETFASQYKNFEDSANKMYLDKVIQLSGVVHIADTNQSKQTVLTLKINDSLPNIICTLEKEDNTFFSGDTITCKGICTGQVTSINLVNCILLQTKKYVPVIVMEDKKSSATAVKPIVTDTVKTIKIFTTQKAQVQFDAGGGIEDIKAINNQVAATITSDGTIKFKLGILGFTFSDALMQQHFNEEYMESKKFPTASFIGKASNMQAVNFEQDGTYKVNITGTLTMHGVTKPINTVANFTVKNKKLSTQSSISIQVADYGISTSATSSAKLNITAGF